MRTLLSGATLCALLLASPTTHAASVYRCVDETGHVTFTRQGCAPSQTAQMQNAFNPTPSSGKATRMAEPSSQQTKRQRKHADTGATLTVVGEQDDGCGNLLTQQARRKAIVEQQVRAGMTRADIESALGRPDAISSNNGQTRYRYSPQKGRSRSVSFDENGCVRAKN